VPAERTSVRTIKAVLQLKFEAHLSQRKIARSLNIGLDTVSLHLKRASKSGYSGHKD
jgi:DNA-binding transcriptional regulator LsrR (DeoR family)